MAIENSTAPCRDCGSTEQSPRAFDRLHAVGEAFTNALLRCSERDLADTCVIGLRLNDELRKRGLVIRNGIKE